MIVQYFKWITGILLRGDFGLSFEWQQPVSELIWERMALTLVLTFSTLLATWGIALPIGVFSAVKKYSIGDYIVTFFSFLGLAIPSFLLALVLMYVAAVHYGQEVGGLFSEQYLMAPWSIGKVIDLHAPPLDPGHHPGGVRHGEPDPRDARQHAGRALQALCHDGAGQGALRVRACW